jgi:hypothetical protein
MPRYLPLLAQPVIFVLVFGFRYLYRTSVARLKAAHDLVAIERWAQFSSGVIVAIFALDGVLLWVIGAVVGGPFFWLVTMIAVVALVWVAWWAVPSHRMVMTSAETVINGRPTAVSAFFADIAGYGRWQPLLVTCGPAIDTAAGPVFHQVYRLPGGDRTVDGDVVLTENRPGEAVTTRDVGPQLSGDYYTFAPDGDGTLVRHECRTELLLMSALIGARLNVGQEYFVPATARRVDELARAKAVFEGTAVPPTATG